MRKIYDCFMFYNEFHMLELRLTELYDHVDYFVIAEANTTHAGNSKPYNFLENKERFQPFLDKIIHVPVDDMPGVQPGQHDKSDCMFNDRHQRNSLARGTVDADDNDIIIVSDLDEIVRTKVIDYIRQDTNHNIWGFRVPCFHFKFNYMWTDPLQHTLQNLAATKARTRMYPSYSDMRHYALQLPFQRPEGWDQHGEIVINHAGWHFTSVGDSKHVGNKMKEFAHLEFRHLADTYDVEGQIAKNAGPMGLEYYCKRVEPVKLDSYFPKTITTNKEKYINYILPDGEKSAYDLLSHIPENII